MAGRRPKGKSAKPRAAKERASPKRAPPAGLDFQNAKIGTQDANAVILCEGALGTPTGKTGNGLLRRSRRFKVRGVIDSRFAGRDAGEVLDGVKNGVPVYASV